MTSPRRRPRPKPRSSARRVLAAAASLAALASLALVSATSAQAADKAGLLWTVKWSAPTTTAGPNPFVRPVELVGTAKYTLGKVGQVAYTITTSSSLPSACGSFPLTGNASQSGSAFTIKPKLACNGTYSVSAVVQSGTGVLAAHAPALIAPFTLADPGTPPGGLDGVAQGSTRTVTLSWAADPDPDVVGYRVRREGVAVGDTPVGVRIHSDVAPGNGTFTYDVESLRWGAGGPGSKSLASSPSAPLTATITPDEPPTPVSSGSGSTGGGSASSGGSSQHGGSGSHPGATVPPASQASAAHLPSAGKANASLPDRSDYRSGGSISSSTPTTTLDDGYAEHLPYKAGSARESVDLASPDRTRSVSRTVAVPGRKGVGFLVPIAIVVVLLAAALQVRSLVGRASALAGASEDEPDIS